MPVRKVARSVLSGEAEGVFSALPLNVLANLRRRNSENALVWNLVYPLAQTRVPLALFLGLTPLWGTVGEPTPEDLLEPFYWGYNLEGERLPELSETLREVDGAGPSTEVDLFLLGRQALVLVEAKHLSRFGRCHRYTAGRCPEIHLDSTGLGPCRYWEPGPSAFSPRLDFVSRPTPESASPTCNRHYQLGRTLLVGHRLAERLGRILHLWVIAPRGRWSTLERDWLDFADRVSDTELWKRMRVLAWEDVAELGRANLLQGDRPPP